jgi:hypothetical protein
LFSTSGFFMLAPPFTSGCFWHFVDISYNWLCQMCAAAYILNFSSGSKFLFKASLWTLHEVIISWVSMNIVSLFMTSVCMHYLTHFLENTASIKCDEVDLVVSLTDLRLQLLRKGYLWTMTILEPCDWSHGIWC